MPLCDSGQSPRRDWPQPRFLGLRDSAVASEMEVGRGGALGGTQSPEVLLTAASIPAALSLSLPTLSVSECGLFLPAPSVDSLLFSGARSLLLSLPLSLSPLSISPLCASLPLSLPVSYSLPCICLSPCCPLSFCLSTPSLFLSISVTFLVPQPRYFASLSGHLCPISPCLSVSATFPHPSLSPAVSLQPVQSR